MKCKLKEVFEWVKYDGRSIPGVCTCLGYSIHVHVGISEIVVLKLGLYIVYEKINPVVIVKEVLTKEEFENKYDLF